MTALSTSPVARVEPCRAELGLSVGGRAAGEREGVSRVALNGQLEGGVLVMVSGRRAVVEPLGRVQVPAPLLALEDLRRKHVCLVHFIAANFTLLYMYSIP